MRVFSVGSWVLAVALFPLVAWGGSIPVVAPEEVGLSPERLERIGAVIEGWMAEDRMVGAVGLLARRGKIGYFETFGLRDRESGAPMRKDTIFRIYSMSKPVTSVGLLLLYEEGRLKLNDPVARYLPELADREVGVVTEDPDTGVKSVSRVPAERDITVRDLMRHTGGLTYGSFGDTEIDRLYREAGIFAQEDTLADMVAKLGTLPLLYQPGAVWHYSVSTDVLGRLIEVLSGLPLDRFFEERIFGPLGMVDTGFYVPEEKRGRLAAIYSPGSEDDATLVPAGAGVSRDYLRPPTLFSGGGGLVSTATDYLRFAQMLLNEGELDGRRLLSRKTVELMTRDHLGEIPMLWRSAGYGFGLGVAVCLDPGRVGETGSVGAYYWGGAAQTLFWVDPKEEFIGIFLTQIKPYGSLTYRNQYRILSYQTIDD